jgi:putative endonuclease
MEAIETKAMKGIKTYLERKGFEIVEEGWAHGNDTVDFIARDEEDLVFVTCLVKQNDGEGSPKEALDRDSLERLAAAYLAEHLNHEDCQVRFDAVSMLVLSDDRAFLRHHRNVLSEY